MESSKASVGLLQASRAALEAAQHGDLDGVARALDAREVAIQQGETPTDAVIALGEQLAKQLRLLRAALREDDARIRQLQLGFCPRVSGPSFDVRG